MTHRSLIDYYTTHERHFSCFLVPFVFDCDSFISVLDAFFLVSEVTVDDVETQSANHKFRWCSVVQYFTLPNSLFNNKPTSLKMKLTNTLIRIDYAFFLLWVFISKVKLLRLRKTSVISSYITSLSIEYLYKFRFVGLWVNGWKSMTNQCNQWIIDAIDDQKLCGLSIGHRLLNNHRW